MYKTIKTTIKLLIVASLSIIDAPPKAAGEINIAAATAQIQMWQGQLVDMSNALLLVALNELPFDQALNR